MDTPLAVPSLCFPDLERTCFACCPPIRPAGYEHIQYKGIIMRVLRENTKAYGNKNNGVIPITGFSCWALGYLDQSCKLIGCLLHPDRNGGTDLRFKIDYGEKCKREICQEGKIFSELGIREKRFWLQLTKGFDSFSFSSRKINPLFNLLNWGIDILRLLASKEAETPFTRESFFQTYPFFLTSVPPRGNAYLLTRLIEKEVLYLLRSKRFRPGFERFSVVLARSIRNLFPDQSGRPYIHKLSLSRQFLDFLRLSARIARMDERHLLILKKRVDEEIEEFRSLWKKRS